MNKKDRKRFVLASLSFSIIIGAGAAGLSIWIMINCFGQMFRLTEVSVPLTSQGMQLAADGMVFSTLHISQIVLLGTSVLYGLTGTVVHFGLEKNKRGTFAFAAVLSILSMGGMIATGVLALLSSQSMQPQLAAYLQYTLNTTFDGTPTSNNSISTAWYNLMQTYQCCGYNNVSDFLINAGTLAYYWNSTGPTYYKNGVTLNTAIMPPCCCIFDSGDGRNMEQMLDANCPRLPNPGIAYYGGCGNILYNVLYQFQSILLYVGFAAGGFSLFIVVGIILYLVYIPVKPKPKKKKSGGKYSSTSYGRGG